jgi:hypothetical protein
MPFFALLDWSVIPERDARRAWPGSPPHPQRAYMKGLLVKTNERFESCTELRNFLVKHPALVVALEFRLVLDPTKPDGFDAERSVPSARHWRRVLQTFDNELLQRLLNRSVQTLRAEIPTLGDSVAFDVKHIYYSDLMKLRGWSKVTTWKNVSFISSPPNARNCRNSYATARSKPT